MVSDKSPKRKRDGLRIALFLCKRSSQVTDSHRRKEKLGALVLDFSLRENRRIPLHIMPCYESIT